MYHKTEKGQCLKMIEQLIRYLIVEFSFALTLGKSRRESQNCCAAGEMVLFRLVGGITSGA